MAPYCQSLPSTLSSSFFLDLLLLASFPTPWHDTTCPPRLGSKSFPSRKFLLHGRYLLSPKMWLSSLCTPAALYIYLSYNIYFCALHRRYIWAYVEPHNPHPGCIHRRMHPAGTQYTLKAERRGKADQVWAPKGQRGDSKYQLRGLLLCSRGLAMTYLGACVGRGW